VRVCRCQGCCSLSVCVCVYDLLIFLQESDVYAGPTVSFSLYVKNTEQKNFSERISLGVVSLYDLESLPC